MNSFKNKLISTYEAKYNATYFYLYKIYRITKKEVIIYVGND